MGSRLFCKLLQKSKVVGLLTECFLFERPNAPRLPDARTPRIETCQPPGAEPLPALTCAQVSTARVGTLRSPIAAVACPTTRTRLWGVGALSEELADLELDEDLLKSASDDEDLNPRPRTTDLSASVQDTFMSLVFAPFDAESCNTHLVYHSNNGGNVRTTVRRTTPSSGPRCASSCAPPGFCHQRSD